MKRTNRKRKWKKGIQGKLEERQQKEIGINNK
jgi:hypothetical protein